MFFFFFFVPVFRDSIVRSSEHTLWTDEAVADPRELPPLQECPFWGSPTRKRYHAISVPRVSALNTQDEDIYDYNVESDLNDDIANSEDDYDDY